MPPFTVLHVCMGNICRSPMAERLLAFAVRQRLAVVTTAAGASGTGPAPAAPPDPVPAEALLFSHSAGTGGWHEGEEMNPPAARQVRARGGDTSGFRARKLRADQIDGADLVLTATADQRDYVLALRPDAADRTFVLGEFGRLLATVDPDLLPSAGADPEAVFDRGLALVEQVRAARGRAPSRHDDDLDDPWGRGDQCFRQVADEIERTVRPLAAILLPGP